MASVMGVKCKVVLTHVDGPVGQMIGQSLGIAEAIRCLNGEGPPDLHELVCKIGKLAAMNIGFGMKYKLDTGRTSKFLFSLVGVGWK